MAIQQPFTPPTGTQIVPPPKQPPIEPTQPLAQPFADLAEKWKKEALRLQAISGQPPVTEKKKRKGLSISSFLPQKRLFTDIGNVVEFFQDFIGAEDKSEDELELQKVRTTQEIQKIDQAVWLSTYFTRLPGLIALGQVTSYEDYIELFGEPIQALDIDVLEEARSVFGEIDIPEIDVPDWLEIEPEKEAQIAQFFETPRQLKPPDTVQRLTVDAILQSMIKPRATLPEGMTGEELLHYASIYELPQETISAVFDVNQAVQVMIDADLEQRQMIDDVLTGIAEWETPDMSFADRAFFAAQSPLQAFADFLEPYMKNVSNPLAGWASITVAGLLPGTQQIEELYTNAAARGVDPWHAAGESFEEWNLAWYYKLPIEIVTDPLILVPGWGLSIPGKIFTKVGLKTLGNAFYATNRGIWKVTDIPFNVAKNVYRNPMWKTTQQLIRVDMNDFRNTFKVAVETHSGKMAHQLTRDDLSTTLTAAAKTFKDTPNLDGNVLVDLGRYLADHVSMTDTQILKWSSRYGGKLIDATPEVVSGVNRILTDNTMQVFKPQASAKRLAALLQIDETPANLTKLAVEIPDFTKRMSTNIDTVLTIGRNSNINAVSNMTQYVMTRQRLVFAGKHGAKQVKGSTLEGIAIGLRQKVDALESAKWRRVLDQWTIRPFARANLASISYPPWNAFEGIAVSTVEGVKPGFTSFDTYALVMKRLEGDVSLAIREAGDVQGMLQTSRHGTGAYKLTPGKIPEQVLGIQVPRFMAGNDWLKWLGDVYPALSDKWGNAIKRNYVVQKVGQHLAQKDLETVTQLKKLLDGAPEISNKSLGMSAADVKQEMWYRLITGTDEVLDAKNIMTNSAMTRNEITKIVKKAELLSPRSQAIADQLILEGKALTETVGFVDEVFKASVEDLRRYPYSAGESFIATANGINDAVIKTRSDLMEIFAQYETMSETASFIPHRMMRQVMEETDILYKTNKFGDVQKVWVAAREDLLRTMDDVTVSLERVKAKILANSEKLTAKQQSAMELVLERSEASNIIRKATLQADGEMLDTFWAQQKVLRTPEAHIKIRADRNELWANYELQSAIPSAGEFVTRQSMSELYHNLPKPKLKPADVINRAMSAQDVAQVFGTNIDGLATGLLDNVAMNGKPYFIQLVKQTADKNPNIFKGFTEDKIGEVYDQLLRQASMNPENDILTQKILLQGEGMKNELTSLKMKHVLTPNEEKAWGSWIDDIAEGRGKIIGDEGTISVKEWDVFRQEAANAANVDYLKAFADYTNEHMLGAVAGMIYPYWNYHQYRWFSLARQALRHPGVPISWGKYQDYSENGFIPTWFPDIEMNPFIGSALGTTFTLTRFDFISYYDQLGYAGEVLDYTQRWGYFPNAPITALISLTPLLSGREPELGAILPPIGKSGLNLLVASDIPGVKDAATWLKDKIFHENFHNYYTATFFDDMQIDAEGTLVGGQTGADIWFKMLRGDPITSEEQALWDEAYKKAAEIGILRAQFPQFRLRTEEYKDAYAKVTAIFEEQLGMSEEFQKNLWKHHQRPTDVVGGLPLPIQAAFDELWEWKIYFGRGNILVAPDVADLKGLIDKYWNKIEGYQLDRLSLQADADEGFISPSAELHFTGREWRAQFSNNWGNYATLSDTLEKDPEFADAVEAITPEGQIAMARRLGFTVAPTTPLQEAINLYFDIELDKITDPYTGEIYDDFLKFWLQREAVRMAMNDEQRDEFDTKVRKYQTPMELTFHFAYNTYIRGFKATDRIIFETKTTEEQVLIKEFYVTDTTLIRKEEIKLTKDSEGRGVIAHYDAERSDSRSALREAIPTLDFWLFVFGYITKPKTDEARMMIDNWEADRSSILITRESDK